MQEEVNLEGKQNAIEQEEKLQSTFKEKDFQAQSQQKQETENVKQNQLIRFKIRKIKASQPLKCRTKKQKEEESQLKALVFQQKIKQKANFVIAGIEKKLNIINKQQNEENTKEFLNQISDLTKIFETIIQDKPPKSQLNDKMTDFQTNNQVIKDKENIALKSTQSQKKQFQSQSKKASSQEFSNGKRKLNLNQQAKQEYIKSQSKRVKINNEKITSIVENIENRNQSESESESIFEEL